MTVLKVAWSIGLMTMAVGAGSIATAEDDDLEMKLELAWAHDNPRESEMVEEAALYEASKGKMNTARTVFRRAETLAIRSGSRAHARS